MVKQDERQRLGILTFNGTATVSVAQTGINSSSHFQKSNNSNSVGHKSSFKKGIFCRYCHRDGHNIDECYKLIGFPSGHPAQGYGKNYGKNAPSKGIGQAFGQGNFNNQQSRNGNRPKIMQIMQNQLQNNSIQF